MSAQTRELKIDCYATTNAILIVTAKAGECARCKTARYTFVNRRGESLCMSCDREARRANGDAAH